MSLKPPPYPQGHQLLAGKKILLTAAAGSGIGFAAAKRCVEEGATVMISDVHEKRLNQALNSLNEIGGAHFAQMCNVTSQEDVDALVSAGIEKMGNIDVLINNAGLVGRGTTKDGFEMTFGVNHVGVFLFTTLLLDKLKESTPSRIVNVASKAHTRTKGIDLDGVRRATPAGTGFGQYAQSKLANVLFSAELADRLQGTGVLSVSLHPGAIATDVWRDIPGPFRWFLKLFLLSVEDGARTTLHCATASDLQTGAYYANERVTNTSAAGADRELGRALWAASEEWVR